MNWSFLFSFFLRKRFFLRRMFWLNWRFRLWRLCNICFEIILVIYFTRNYMYRFRNKMWIWIYLMITWYIIFRILYVWLFSRFFRILRHWNIGNYLWIWSIKLLLRCNNTWWHHHLRSRLFWFVTIFLIVIHFFILANDFMTYRWTLLVRSIRF